MLSKFTNTAVSEANHEPEPDIVQTYKTHLQTLGRSPGLVGPSTRTVQHLVTWMLAIQIGIEALDIRVLHRFLNHDCACPGPRGRRKDFKLCSGPVHRFLGFLMETGRVRMPTEIEAGGRVLGAFLQTLAEQGHADGTIAIYRRRCRHFIVWLYLNSITLAEIDDYVVSRFLSHDCACAHPHFFARPSRFTDRNDSKPMIDLFVGHLARTGIVPLRPAPMREEESWCHLPGYLAWLRHCRGMCDGTIRGYRRAMRTLLSLLGDDPDQYSATLIRDVVHRRLEVVSRNVVRHEASALRSYLRFLDMEGRLCRRGLAGAVPTIPRGKLPDLPRHLPREDIERIIASCDAASPKGKRNRAILLLLARLALRAGDVAGLRMDDIDWDGATVRVSGKSRRAAVLPLPQDVGDAIRDYLINARPAANADWVFLRTMPPLHQPLTSSGVSSVARSAIRRSGVEAEGLPAAHLFRHSTATSLLRDDTPVEVISTLLRHASTQTTATYARVDVQMLRAVAQPWPTAGDER